jgi:hypothetical protein
MVGSGWLSPKQYFAERMCVQKAKRQGKSLPDNYREQEKWKGHYHHQMRLAADLLEKYDERALCRALETREGKKAYSLSADWFLKLLEAEQSKLALQQALAEDRKARPEEECSPLPAAAPPAEASRLLFVHKPSLLSKLQVL